MSDFEVHCLVRLREAFLFSMGFFCVADETCHVLSFDRVNCVGPCDIIVYIRRCTASWIFLDPQQHENQRIK